jgi:hypothetical protein
MSASGEAARSSGYNIPETDNIMRIAMTCAALAAALNLAPAGAAHAGAKYKIAAQTRAVKYGSYYPVALTDFGLAAGTLYGYTGDDSAYFSDGKYFGDDGFCQILGESGGTELSGISRDSALTYTAGQCTTQNAGYVYNGTTNVTTAVQYPGANLTIVSGVSNSGRVGGYYYDASGTVHGFYFDSGIYTSFDPAGSTYTEVRGIAPNGTLSGLYTDATGLSHGFMVNAAGTYTTIDYPGAKYTVVTQVSSQNLAVGTIDFPNGAEQSFAWRSGSFLLPPLPSNTYSQATAVSEAGIVVGTYGIAPPNVNGGFVWNPATSKLIVVKAPAGATYLDVRTVNSTHAQIAGSYYNAANKEVGYIATCKGTKCF